MSYRIWAEKENGEYFQLFGNNEYPEEFIDELKNQGCEIDEDGCFESFEIKELQPIINSINSYIIKVAENTKKYGDSIYDFSSDFENYKNKSVPLWLGIEMKINWGYMFIVHNLISFFSNEIDKSNPLNYKIKDNCKIIFSGG